MAEEKSPFDNIDKEFTLVNRPFEPELGDDIEVELPTDSVVNEDGSVDVGPEEIVQPQMGFGSNLVQALSDDDLAGISSMVLEKVEEDKSARQEWINTYIKGLELLGVKYENRTEPFQGATGVIHPMLNEAVSQFQSQAYKELLPPSGPVRTQVVGDITPELEKQAERVKDYMNYEIIHTMSDARYDNDPAYRQDIIEKLDRSDLEF